MFFCWITILIAIPILWLLQNIIHELSHGLAINIGWDWDFKIWPFPGYKLGRFTFAHITFSRNEHSKNIDAEGDALISIMPKITNLFFILVTGTMLLFGLGNSIYLSILAVFVMCNYIDALVGTQSIFRNSKKDSPSDIWRFHRGLKLNLCKHRVIMAIALTLLTIFVGGSIIPYFFIGG